MKINPKLSRAEATFSAPGYYVTASQNNRTQNTFRAKEKI
jgi:hypothetical protein